MTTCYYPFVDLGPEHRANEWGRWLTWAGEILLTLNMHRGNAHRSTDAWCCERSDYPGEPGYVP